jgi:Ca2+-binding EF-hand superfamily protein
MVEMIFSRYDRNNNGVLERDEWSSFRSDPSGYDANRDGRITKEEFAAAMANRFGRDRRGGGGDSQGGNWYSRRDADGESDDSESAKKFSTPADGRKSYRFKSPQERLAEFEDLPEWFGRSDVDGDGQVRMSEYSTSWTEQVVADFNQFDLNGDGIVTPNECVRAREAGAVQGAPTTVASNDAGGSRYTRSTYSGSSSTTPPSSESRLTSSSADTAESSSDTSASPTTGSAPSTTGSTGSVPSKYVRYAVGFIRRYDTNKDGVLTQDEWTKMNDDYSSADTDGDGRITPLELGAAFMKK